MAASTGYILAAAGIVAANEVIFAPVAQGKQASLTGVDFNWRLVPVTAVAAFTLAGLEQLSEPLGKGLAILALLTVLIVPVGNAPTPVDNLLRMLGMNKQ